METVGKLENDPIYVIERLEPLRHVCSGYWNRTYNVRLGQLCEKLFEAYWQKLYNMRNPSSHSRSGSSSASASVAGAEFQDVLKTTLEIGEEMLASYRRYWEPYNLTMAIFFHRLASLYRLVRDGKGIKRGSYYYLAAGEIWKMHDEPGCQKFFEELSQRLLTKGNIDKDAAEERVAGGVTLRGM